MGRQGFDPLGICDMTSDTSSSEDDSAVLLEGQTHRRVLETQDHDRAHSSLRNGSGKQRRVSFQLEDYSSLTNDGNPSNNNDFVMLNWTSPAMRQNQHKQIESSKISSLLNATSEQKIQALLSPESDQEIQAIYDGTELKRQREAIPMGPLHTQMEFGDKRIRDIAAIDSGATQNFISKSWLYHFLRKGGNMKVLTFNATGHETFDGSVFYTYGTVEIYTYMQFGDKEKTFKLIANVTKDATAMYSVVLGTAFLSMNGIFVVDQLKGLFLAEDFPEALKVSSHRIKVNWNLPAKDVYASQDIRMSPGMKLLTLADLQDVSPRKKKKYKTSKAVATLVSPNACYAFIPKAMPSWSHTAMATALVQPRGKEGQNSLVQNNVEGLSEDPMLNHIHDGDDDLSVDSNRTGRCAEEVESCGDLDDLESLEHMDAVLDVESSGDLHRVRSLEREDSHNEATQDASLKGGVSTGFSIPLQIANLGDEPVVIRKGTYLGQVHEVQEENIPVNVHLGKDDSSIDFSSKYSNSELDELIENLKINEIEDISEEQRQRLVSVVKRYANVFAKHPEEVGNVNMLQVTIDVQDHKPIRCKPYRVSPKEREIIRVEVEKMLRNNIIAPSTSEWASPVVLVPKPDGSTRFAIDYRKLNEVTRKEIYPMPNVQDYLDVLRGNEYFSIMDGQQAYFGLPMAPESRQYTAFICHMGQYEMTRMGFGLCNAPAIFQRLMNSVLQGLLWEECLVYLDDICIMSANADQHIDRLERLLKRLATVGILLKPSKCHLLQRSIKLLGHIIDREGTRPAPPKVKAIYDFVISSRADIHTFLGMTGYYATYCPNYAEVTVPLRQLVHEKGPFVMTSKAEEAIHKLKVMLTSEPLLAHPDWDEPFEIHTDASGYAIGAVLCQVIGGKERVIGYYSRLLRDPEKKWDTTQKECLAVVWAVKKLRPYLYGRQFVIKTDHAALKWLLNLKDHTGRLMRWSLLLQDYNHIIVHRAGKKHGNADALSRLIYQGCLESQSDTSSADIQTNSVASVIANIRTRQNHRYQRISSFKKGRKDNEKDFPPSSFHKPNTLLRNLGITVLENQDEVVAYEELAEIICREQDRDPIISDIKRRFSRLDQQDFRIGHSLYRIRHGMIFLVKPLNIREQATQVELLMIPTSLQNEIIRLYPDHPTRGHFGASKTLKRLRHRYFWMNMPTMVDDYVKSCSACQRKNQKEVRNAEPRPVISRGPFDIVAVDCLRLPDSIHGNTWVLVFIDYFTKYANTYVLRGNPSKSNVSRCFVKYLSQHSLVRLIRCDRGSEFMNSVFTDMCDQLGIELEPIPTEHHRANGLVERFNQTLQKSLCKVLDESVQAEYWEEYLDFVTFAYNTSFHKSIQDTPFFLVYGRHAVLPGDRWMFSKAFVNEDRQKDPNSNLDNNLFPEPKDMMKYKSDMIARFAHTYARAQHHLKKYYDRIIEEAAQKKQVTFDLGEQVWVYQPEVQSKDGIRRKLMYQWHGPYWIAERHPKSSVLYRVFIEDRSRKLDSFVHVNRIRSYRGRELRPTDVVLPVPTFDLDYENLPRSSRMDIDVEDEENESGNEERQTENDIEFELVQEPYRKPTTTEQALVGKVFLDEDSRFQVFKIAYHKDKKIMVAWYKELIKKGSKWTTTGSSAFSSIPEVAYWIERSASQLYD